MKKGISVFFQMLIFFTAICLVAGVTYIINWTYLAGNGLTGNDAYSFYSVVMWVDKYFPKVPFWYPLGGGGVSIISGYPVLAAYMVAIITRISHFDLVQSFRLLGFLSIPLLSIGVFFFVWTRLTEIKNGIVRAVLGLIASLFVVVSPSSWLWLTRWGFYAESISLIFVPWAILFFDLFFENAIEGKRGWSYKIGLLGSIVFFLLSFLTHFLSIASLAVFFGLTALIRFAMFSGDKKLFFKRILGPGIILIILFLGTSFFKVFQYGFYMNQVSVGGFSGYGRMVYSEMANNTLPLSMMLSLKAPPTITDPHALIFDMRFPFYVWILFALGFIFSIKKSNKIFSFGVYGILGLIFTSVLSVRYFFSGIPIISGIANLMAERGYLIVARVIIPIVAVYGAYIIWEALFKKIVPKLLDIIHESLSLIFALIGVSILIILFYNSPYKDPYLIGTGAFGGVSDVRDIWKRMTENTQNTSYLLLSDQFRFKNWRPFMVNSDISASEDGVKKVFAQLPILEKFRFDISTFAGGIFMAAPLVTQNSQMEIYINTLSLINHAWSYQSQVMYTVFPITQKPGVLTELGKWFGLNYVYLSGSKTEPNTYWQQDSNWEKIENEETAIGWYKFNIPVSLVAWDTRPKILIVTDTKRGLYDQLFRFATWGAIPYDKANIIIGAKSIDSYSLNDLKNYDVVIMRGYSYKSQQNAYSLLNEYIKGGGKLIFDTGWQYEIPDYILDKTPDFMPFDSLDWQNLDINSTFSLSGEGFGEINLSEFGDLKYESSSWGVSVAQNLKPWAKINLIYDGKPLVISGKYGNGNVTWIGFNLIAHAIAKNSVEEAKFFNALLANSLEGKQSQNLDITYTRENPDKIEFDLQSTTTSNSGIYFRESYFPYWKAYLQSGNNKTNLKIERVGPGFMYINLPPTKNGDKVILEIQISIWQKIANTISILTGILVLVVFAKPSLFSGIKFPKLKAPKNENEDY